ARKAMKDSSLLSEEELETTIEWLRSRQVDEVECLVPDANGMMRGKIVPREDFIRALGTQGLRLPESVLVQAVTGHTVDDTQVAAEVDSDIRAVPDVSTLRLVPWYKGPTAQVICDAWSNDGHLIDFAPRSVLRRVLQLYSEKGLQPVVAPELRSEERRVGKEG